MRLTKHHGLGNDFLVLLDERGDASLTSDVVRSLCDRRRGVGADGVLRATPTPTEGVDAKMELFNADGSVAEMSGNGIRCLAQALLLEGWAARDDRVVIATQAGVRTVSVRRTFDESRWESPGESGGAAASRSTSGAGAAVPRTLVMSVDMGAARIGPPAPEWTGAGVRRAMWADMGNPHLVAEIADESDVSKHELVHLGEKVNGSAPHGANVHLLVAGPGDDAISIRTYERGVGLTEACGTGACASAAVAHHWGIVGPSVTVEMPGGQAVVDVGATVTLTGPATVVAAIDHPWPG
jgi:diaminopimelate epimerase